MGWWKKYAIVASIVFLLLSFSAAAIPPPLVIYGFVYYNGEPVADVTVEAIDENTGERISDTTDEKGFFTITLGNPPYEWKIGDKIVLKARKACLYGYKEFIVKSDEPIKKDISLKLYLKANFSFSPLNPKEGEEINFTDNSTGAQRWEWDFGDGNISYEKNPKHVYSIAGKYNVTLTIFCNGFNASITKEISIMEKETKEKEKKKKIPEYLLPPFIIALLLAIFIRRRCIKYK